MRYLLWDFDNTLAFRDGMWSSTIYELLNDYGYKHISMNDIGAYLKSGFPWHSSEKSHKEFFQNRQWWEYMNNYFSNILQKLGIEEEIADKISNNIKFKYIDLSKWHLYDDTTYCLSLALKRVTKT